MGWQTTNKHRVSGHISLATFQHYHQLIKNHNIVKCNDFQTGVLQRCLRASENERSAERRSKKEGKLFVYRVCWVPCKISLCGVGVVGGEEK